ncbi:PREDICTED: peroxisome biogenesis factor 1 isoform X1 [Cyprinodon variegatus]|uniref:peroxisome biogenesis factor 1 isoform X1 n=1 Tax=Cyprinodon variegatus TaxID=28743 RepID=UPI000742ADB9|nr:PREDICTED: peroxisome biogenesis factor 1 isoform X1 [Cyprinodon variegatus]
MFSSQGIQAVRVVFNNAKNCFLHLPLTLISHLSLQENQALELSWGNGPAVFLSWTRNRVSSDPQDHNVELCWQLGEKLGLKDGEQAFLKACHQVSSLSQVFVEPLSADDWEILELHSSTLEQQLLDQIRVVFQHAVFPVWVNRQTVIYIRIASVSPFAPFGRLEQFTELMVSPKIRSDIGNLDDASTRSSLDRPDASQSSASKPISDNIPCSDISQHRGGITDLKSLLRHVIRGSYYQVKEHPPVPNIPVIFPDSIYRVCGFPPDPLCTINHIANGVIHIFPWSLSLNTTIRGGQSVVTYGRLFKVLSPKEAKEKSKQGTEKRKNGGGENDRGMNQREEAKGEEATVVRVVCHEAEMLERGHSKGKIHSGRVWIPQPLACKLNIQPHSSVRIKPVKSVVKVASDIRLQPLTSLLEENDDEIQTTFLGWLHTKSHEPLACLTPRSGTVLLHGNDAKMDLCLTVLKPEPENDPPDQMFLLAPTVLQKENIQVSRQTMGQPAPNTSTEAKEMELLSPKLLGGIGDLIKTGFQFISHNLLGSPLSRELCSFGRGLKGGALLITGAKGSGKSSLSRALCRKAREDLDAHVEVLDCKKLQGKRADTVRQVLQDVFEQAEWGQPSVVLLDDLDHLTHAPSSAEHEHGPEALLQQHIAQSLYDIVDEAVLHSSLVCLIITSQSEHSLHPSLTEVQGSHLIQGFLNIQPPDQAQRAEILHHLIQRKPFLSEESLKDLDLEAVAKRTEGYTAQDLTVLLERAIHANTMQKGPSDQAVCLSWRDFLHALSGFTPPSLWGVELHTPSGVGLEKVGGLREVRQQLMDTILLPAKYPILFSNLPIRHCSGILLYGAPGTGKTLLIRAVAKDSGMNFISIKGPELLSKYIGASEQGVRDVFQRAQGAKPCILFFDEFDSLAPRRGHDSTGVTDRVVNQLLTELDGVEGLQGVYVLAATSRPDLIDPALLRPGRLDKSLYCPPPDQEARIEILKALSSGLSLAPDVDLEQLAAVTQHFTGADLKALLYNAQLEAVHSSGVGTSQELTSVSDSDMSLSSMIFPNNTSSSDDSVGEGDQNLVLDQSMSHLEPAELHVEHEEQHANVWRLYFGSSFESETENSPVSRRDSPYVSGPNSREPVSSLPPAYMSSIQTGYKELCSEQLERLQQDIRCIKNSYRKGKQEELVWMRSASSQLGLLLSQAHIKSALAVTRPSLSPADWSKYSKLYETFGGLEDKLHPRVPFTPGQHVTLA